MSPKELQTLQGHWYKKLEDSGFIDIEDVEHPESPLKAWHSLKWNNINLDFKEKVEQYYQKARDLLHTYEFENDMHRRIWEMHTEGLSKRKIEIALNGAYKRETIGNIIKALAQLIQ